MYYFFQYFPYIALMMLLCGLSPVLMEFHKENLSARIRCSALADTRIAAQIGLSCFVYVVILWLAFIVIAACLAGPAQLFSTSGLLGLLNSFVYILIAASIALLLGAFSIDFNIVNMIANILWLGMSFLLGEKVLMIGRFLPAYWNVRIVNMLAPYADDVLSMRTYWMCIGIQLLFFLVLFTMYLVVEHRRAR